MMFSANRQELWNLTIQGPGAHLTFKALLILASHVTKQVAVFQIRLTIGLC